MKQIIISGSLAYDRIMDFSENFSDYILPDKIDNLNVCFQVNGVTEHLGGTAGNIAYALNLLEQSPRITATIGRDNQTYFDRFAELQVTTEGIKIIENELTAGAYITTDIGNNQITGFNPGAMKYSSDLDFTRINPANDLLLISPGNLDDMISYPKKCKPLGIKYIFDPGQSLPMLQAEDLKEVVSGCMILIVNDYEFNLIREKTGLTRAELLALSESTIITLGDSGSELHTGGTTTAVPACKAAKVIDPTGAGDAYRGGLISGLLQGKDLTTCAKMGSAVSSFAVEALGTQLYTFSMDEFRARLDSI